MAEMTETGVILPRGVRGIDDPMPTAEVGTHVLIDNRTDLPDGLVEASVQDVFVENASLAWGHTSTFQTYANEGGSLLARTKFTVPKDVFEEIKLCRDIADKDDDIKSTLRMLIAVAYEGGMENFHADERTVSLFNEMARSANLDHWFEEIYREYIISQQVTTITAYIRERLTWTPNGTDGVQEERVVVPRTAVLPAECIRAIRPGLFGEEGLAYIPERESLRRWLEEFFGQHTTAARKAAMAREDPVAATLFIERVRSEDAGVDILPSLPTWAYRLNPRMAARFTAPKGSCPYPRPLLTANFALIEAKRLLNLMDYALLQGGANYIVVAKKGTDEHKASPEEIRNLTRVVARASRTGVIVGDHRLDFEIITPELKELLNTEKRALVGRKLAQLMLGVPEPPAEARAEAMKSWMELVTRVVTSDRNKVKRHVENAVYEETAKRNRRVLKGAAKIWHPKIILQGTQFFTDMVLKLGDRGNISRKTLTEVAGFSWEAEVAQRRAELEAGIDEIMIPGQIPFDSPQNAPNDSGDGRPRGGSPDNGLPGARPGAGPDPAAPPRLLRGPGEPVRAWWDEALNDGEGGTLRAGEITYQLLSQYPEQEEGRVSATERRGVEASAPLTEGAVTVIPVNQGHDCLTAYRAVRLAPGLGVILGYRRSDRAVVAKGFSFRTPEFDELAAQELVLRLGFRPPEIEEAAEEESLSEMEIVRDEETGAIVRLRPVRADS